MFQNLIYASTIPKRITSNVYQPIEITCKFNRITPTEKNAKPKISLNFLFQHPFPKYVYFQMLESSIRS